MLARKIIVKLTGNFERNLENIESFLRDAEALETFDALLDDLTETIIPNLERFPDMGRPFLDRPARSVEVNNGVQALHKQLESLGNDSALREYLFADYLVLYACSGNAIYLLSIKHHRQLSFDFPSIWRSA